MVQEAAHFPLQEYGLLCGSSSTAHPVTATDTLRQKSGGVRYLCRSEAKACYVGLDGHKDTITVVYSIRFCEIQLHNTIPNEPNAIRKLMSKMGPKELSKYVMRSVHVVILFIDNSLKDFLDKTYLPKINPRRPLNAAVS